MYAKMSTEMDSDAQDFYTYEATLNKLMAALGSELLKEASDGKK